MHRLVFLLLALGACKDKDKDKGPDTAPLACNDVKSCRHLAHELEESGDIESARRGYTHACDLRDAVSCYDVARLELEADASLRNVGRAQQFAERACDLGLADACNDASVHLGTLGQTSARGRVLLEKGCSLGCGVSCYNLAVQYRQGWGGVKADLAKANELLATACDRDHAHACAELGVYAMLGHGVPEDPTRAIELLDKACTLEVQTCTDLASAYEDGMGVAEDPARARALYDRACGAGAQEACRALARIRAEN